MSDAEIEQLKNALTMWIGMAFTYTKASPEYDIEAAMEKCVDKSLELVPDWTERLAEVTR
jgi:hypothetical protein